MAEEKVISLPAFFGVKSGMTRIFDENGTHLPVTVVKLIPNVVSQVKTKDKDGYQAYQVSYGEKRPKLINKPMKGHLTKGGVSGNLCRFSEIRINDVDVEKGGAQVSYESFKPMTYIDVTSFSKGKGFQGVIKRYRFRGGPKTHGSHFHRSIGSVGNRATPGKIFKLKKMPGHMGFKKTTIQNQLIVGVELDKGYLLVKGTIPGAKGTFVKISKALKKS